MPRIGGRPRLTARAVVRWLLPAVWIVVAVVVGRALTETLDERSSSVRAVAVCGAWSGWAVAAVATVIPSTISLTATRVLVPASLGVVGLAAACGATAATTVFGVLACAVATALCLTPELGMEMVQASAYGDEVRVPLRPPIGYLLVAVVAWISWLALVLSGPLLVASGVYAAGMPLTVLAIASTAVLPRRWHQLSRRWLVFVPAGVVVHDRIVLAETLMVRRHELASVGLALSASTAVDLTGPASGHVLQIDVTEPVTALLAQPPAGGGEAQVAAMGFLVAPSRPGFALAEAQRRRLPVGSHR